jgi:hypothetical protein
MKILFSDNGCGMNHGIVLPRMAPVELAAQ